MGGTARVVAAVRHARMLRPADADAPLAALLDELRLRLDRLEAAVKTGTRIGELQLVRYPSGGFFLPHADASLHPRERRRISVIVYLNDDFEGGETEFMGTGEVVRPAAGAVLTFAAHLPHTGRPVANGEKWVVVAWLERD
jgi:predicted 2-oxoglutarate/Fe(II)-dependent dioxygenase YbiX